MLAETIQKELVARGKAMELHVYDADHRFMNDTRPEAYNPKAAKLAWKRSIEFLKQHLGRAPRRACTSALTAVVYTRAWNSPGPPGLAQPGGVADRQNARADARSGARRRAALGGRARAARRRHAVRALPLQSTVGELHRHETAREACSIAIARAIDFENLPLAVAAARELERFGGDPGPGLDLIAAGFCKDSSRLGPAGPPPPLPSAEALQ